MKEGWEYKTIKECCTELFAGGDVPKPDVSKNKTQNFTVPIYTNGVENEGLYGYTNNARVYEPAVTISARGTIGATFRRYTPFYPAIRLITAVPNKDLLCIDYLYYALKTLTVGNSGTSIPQLTIPNIKNIVIPVPPLSEQQSIVNYLDSAFAKIDAMKANAEKSLMEAKALFQASLKEMLESKEGWEYKRLKEVANFISGYTPNKEEISNEGKYPYFKVAEMNIAGNELYMKKTSLFINSPKKIFPKGSIIFPKNGGAIYTEKKRILEVDSVIDLNTEAIYPTAQVELMYLYFLLTFTKISSFDKGGGLPSLDLKKMSESIIPVPPLSEQQRIIATLDSLKSKVDRLQANFEKISQECDALKQALLREVFEG